MNQSIADLFDSLEFDPKQGGGEKKEFQDLPDGKYATEILEASLAEDKNANPFIRIKARVSSGDKAGRYLFPNLYMRNDPVSINIVKGVLAEFGLENVKFKDLKNRLTRVNGLKMTITKSSKPNPKNPDKPFVNYYFDSEGGDDLDAGFE